MIFDLPRTNKSQISYQILTYLIEHPNAQDTLEGIVEWWLLERAITFQKYQVKKALTELIAKGLVIEQKGNDSIIQYRVNLSRFEEAKKYVKKINK